MALNLTSLNVRGLRDPSRCLHLLGELLNLRVNFAAMQETHFICAADCWPLEGDFVIFSAFGSRCSAEVSLLVGRSLNVNVNIVFAGDEGWLVVVDIAVKTFEFRVVAVYAPNTVGERRSFFRQLEPFLDYLKWLVLMGDWNAILDPKVDKGGRGASGLGTCESSLINFLAEFDLINRFRLDHSGKEIWTWIGNLPSGQVWTYLDSVRRADADFISCLTFHWIGLGDHKLVRVSLWLVNRPSLASYWKLNTSLLEIRDFWEQLETLIQRALVGVVTGNRWWESLKFRIRDFAIKYG